MTLRTQRDQISGTAGYHFRYIAGFLSIFAVGLVVLRITMEPYH